MRITDGTENCAKCQRKKSVIYCDGCGIPLCIDCRFFDMWGYGCGHVDTKVFCSSCLKSPNTNPYYGSYDNEV